MPDLPERADIDQLRRQARELLRAAVAGQPEALARLRAVSQRPTLAAAQLAIAREHGLPSWPALRSAVESRRPAADRPARPDAGRPQAQDVAPGRWSFGGGGTIEVAEGELTLGLLIAGPEGAFLEASLAVAEPVARARQARRWAPELRDITVTDDQGSTSTVRFNSGYAETAEQRRFEAVCAVDPVPPAGRRWLDVHGRDTSVTRLLRSGLAAVRVGELSPLAGSPAERELRDTAESVLRDYLHHDLRGGPDLKRRCRDLLAQTAALREGALADGTSPLPGQFTRLCTALIRQRPPSGLPSGWHSVLNDADRADGPRLQVDLDTVLPLTDEAVVRLNTLASWPGSWDLHLQVSPGWWVDSADGMHKWAVITTVFAEDDLGGLYLSNFGGSSGRPGYEEVKLSMRPRLAPAARLLKLTFATETQQVTAEVPLAP
ncbi:MAG TPA: hypothetical protein VHV09_15635 [Trebonia sp.]|jgi:hypothetical protein|nr:hypothetical protein [Trebonia sp.]